MAMGYFKVRPGHQVGQSGRTVDAGEVLELPDHVGRELRDKVVPCTPTGEPIEEMAVDEGQLAAELARARDHERITLLEHHVERCRHALALAEQQLAEARVRQQPTVAAAPPAAASPRSPTAREGSRT
jgi:hypothetical protein